MSSSVQLLLAGARWRLYGSRRAADELLAAMNGDDEQQRMIAGMSLVKAGERSARLIERRIEAGEATAPQVRLLADIGGARARDVLRQLAADGPSDLRQAAVECIDLLERIDSLKEG